METEVKSTKLSSCAGTLARMLEGFKIHMDSRLIVGYATEKEQVSLKLE